MKIVYSPTFQAQAILITETSKNMQPKSDKEVLDEFRKEVETFFARGQK